MLDYTFKDEIPSGGKRLYNIIDAATNAIIQQNCVLQRSNENEQEGTPIRALVMQEIVNAINSNVTKNEFDNHNHDDKYQPKGSYASSSHNHDNEYQPKGSYASSTHKHAWGDISDKPTILNINHIYPVGSIYMSVNNVSPASFLGGTWTPIKDRFLLGAGGSYSVNATGGETSHTLTVKEMPYHRHSIYAANGGGSITSENGKNFPDVGTSNKTFGYDMPTDHAGGGASHNNMPPYYAVYIWRRTA